MSFFDDHKFNAGRYSTEGTSRFASPSDELANNGAYVVSFYHVPTRKSVYFKAYITAYNETFNSDWSAEQVYGRADPLYMFKQTQRSITLAIKIPAETHSEAYENLGKVGKLSRFLYPNYTSVDDATTIAQSPLVRMKVMNLARDMRRAELTDEDTQADMYSNYTSNPNADRGLLGSIANLAVNHNITEEGVMFKGQNTVLPKLIDINLTFNPIHEHPLGWQNTGEDGEGEFGFGYENWPYGVELGTVLSPAPVFNTIGEADANSAQADEQVAEAATAMGDDNWMAPQIAGYDMLAPLHDDDPQGGYNIFDPVHAGNESTE